MELTTVVIILVVVLIIFVALNNVTVVNIDTSSVQSNCTQTQYGCCPDGINSKINQSGSSCPNNQNPTPNQIGGCAGTRYGCCPNSLLPKADIQGSNCPH